MMNKDLGRVRILFFITFLALATSACSTARPVSSGRKGMFDGLSHRGGSAHDDDDDEVAGSIGYDHLRPVVATWRWPLNQVGVTSDFGKRRGEFHEGIDLRASSGTPVFAVQNGVVLYSGNKIRGYGKMIVIKHASGLSTIYAHNSKLLVQKGQTVKRGQKISFTGNTGKSTGPHLHFEVRSGSTPLDPARILPEPGHVLAQADDDLDDQPVVVKKREPAAARKKIVAKHVARKVPASAAAVKTKFAAAGIKPKPAKRHAKAPHRSHASKAKKFAYRNTDSSREKRLQ